MGEEAPLRSAPRRYPLVGHAPQFLSDKLGFLLRCAGQSDAFEIRLGRGRAYLLTDPEDIRHVLVTEHRKFDKTPRITEPPDPKLFAGSLVASPSKQHLGKRRMLQPLFHERVIVPFADVVVDCTEEALERWQDEFDVFEKALALTQQIRLRVLLGALAGEVGEELIDALGARWRYIEHTFLSIVPYAGRRPSPVKRGYRVAQRRLEELLLEQIRGRRIGAGPGRDLLSILAEPHPRDGTSIGDEQLFAEAQSFLASSEVSSRALAWTFCLLAEHPEVQRRLAREASEVLARNGAPAGDVSGLEYAQMVLSESLRLYPATRLFVRIAFDDVQLPSGTRIASGSKVYLSPFVSHRNARYFPDPDRFDPARFRPGPQLSALPKFAYFPFGGGPRVCMGEGFVRMEAALVLSRLLGRAELRLAPDQRVEPDPRITLGPRNGVRIRLSPR
jgi:cytochrome P450